MQKNEGYVIDTTYPLYFYKEMQPLWLKTILDVFGLQTINIDQSFSYLELGCAKGINLIIAALHYPQGKFVGIDFNQEHIQSAKKLVQLLDLKNIEFIETDFETFLATNIQKYDFIVNHGTFSWVSSTQQQNILEIASKYLNDLGVFYLHYMCYPGSTELQPIQKLLNLVDQKNGISSLDGIYKGKELFTQLRDAGAFIDYPKIQQIQKTLEQNDEYLAHEFLTNHWQPFYSVDVHERVFDVTKMAFIGSANPCDNIENISIPSKLHQILKDTKDPALKEYLKDIARNSKQRSDIFQKNPKRVTTEKQLNILNSITFKVIRDYDKHQKIVFKTPIGNIQAHDNVVYPLLDLLKHNHCSLGDLSKLVPFQNNLYFLIETIFLLMNEGFIHPFKNDMGAVNNLKITSFNNFMQDSNMHLRLSKYCVVNV